MKLSIITINRNNLDGLQKTINSVIAQTFSDFEWIVIDGGSTDGSRELIEQNADHFSFWVSEPDKGIYNAINKGIAHAQGEYIQILNSGDTLFEETTLEKLFLYNFDADINYGDALLHYPDGSTIDKHYPDTITLNYFIHNVINHQATFFKRQVFDGYPYDEKYLIAGDWAYCMEAVCRGLRFQHIHQTIVNYDNSGISSQWSERQIKEREDILNTYIPPQLKPDMKVLDEIHKLHQRRSTAKLYDICLRFCKWWDKNMKTIEKWRQ
jgi:glycosyltransferase involved in cell wall biosynthesis